MTNAQLASLFEEIADLLELTGQDRFRVNSYRRVARAVEDLPRSAADMLADGSLGDQPGIGKTTLTKVNEALTTGKIAMLEELQAEVPPGVPPLLKIPNLGPKKVAALWQAGVTSLDDLKLALDDGRVAALKGFGPKSAEKIKSSLAFAETAEKRMPLGVAWTVAEMLVADLKSLDGVRRVETAGSLRRRRETVGDIDILVDSDDGSRVIQHFLATDGVEQTLAAGDTKGSAVLATTRGRIQVDVRVVPAQSFGAALQYFTGSMEHNRQLRELAIKQGYKLNEYGLFDADENQVAGAVEGEIYGKLGLICPPPELREDRGELLLQAPPDLIELADIRGDLHMHTDWSDGRNTLLEMVTAARASGLSYIAIADHTHSSAIANGLDPARMEQQIKRVAELNAQLAAEGVQFTILAGAEVDIKADGSLDYSDDLLAQLDFVVASIHSGLDSDRKKVTHRVMSALENRFVCVIGHPTGRLINARRGMDLDLDLIFRTAAETGTALEVNASFQRLDLSDVNIRAARDAGCKFFINTDAHSTDGLEAMKFGIATARRGGLTQADVLNTRPLDQLKSWVSGKRRRAV